MFFNLSLQVVLRFAIVARIIACTYKFVNNIGLKKFTDRVCNDENATTILVFLQYFSQICLTLNLAAFENVLTHFFVVIYSTFTFASVLSLEKLFLSGYP